MSPLDNLRKFFTRPWRERSLFVEAFILLGVMRAAILLLSFRRITKIMGLSQGATSSVSRADMAFDPAVIGWAVKAAAARTYWESACLAQALTGMAMLSRRGIGATLYLGVAKDESNPESVIAHAWVRCGDDILTGADGFERYSPISSFFRPVKDSTCKPPINDRIAQ